ncbi:MAG: efflux RND transporter periplasmic adaptor subunit, partial [Terriglobales bacterium]
MTTREKSLLMAGLAAGIILGLVSFWMISSKDRGTPPAAESATAATEPSSMPNVAPARDAEIELSSQEQQAIGLKTYTVAMKTVGEELRTVGRVEQAETQLSTISARVGGRLDKLFIDFTGQPVRRGQAVASIYSPQVVASAEEYKLALQARRNLGAGAHEQAISQGDDLVQASRRRLELWGLTREQVDGIASTDALKIHVTTYSTVQGVIMERKVAEGQYVQEGEALYTVSDLSTIWVLADVYEADLSRVRIGQAVQVDAEGLGGASSRGTVSFIDPTINPQTRTASVRIQLPNPGLRLRPGMFVNVRLASGKTTELAIPRSAVLETGEKKIVYVAQADGMFARREIEAGSSGGEFVGVRRGLKAGEEVVINGAFLIDSQTRVSGAMSGMFGGSMGYEKGKGAAGDPTNTTTKYVVNVRVEPDPPKEGPVRAFVDLRDAAGKAVSDASVAITFLMPAMPAMGMAEMRNTHALAWDGKQYSGDAKVQSSGTWIVMVDVTRAGQRIAS